jgi:hypothetical protein
MKIGDLVRPIPGHFTASEQHWLGMIVDFHIRVDNCGEPQERLAVVRWNQDFSEEEEYIESLEVVNESR